MRLLDRRFGLAHSPANVHFPKWNVAIVPEWPLLLSATRGHVDDWPQTTFVHSMALDCKEGVDVFNPTLTSLFDKLTIVETTLAVLSTYEICLYLLFAFKKMFKEMLRSTNSAIIKIDYNEGK